MLPQHVPGVLRVPHEPAVPDGVGVRVGGGDADDGVRAALPARPRYLEHVQAALVRQLAPGGRVKQGVRRRLA